MLVQQLLQCLGMCLSTINMGHSQAESAYNEAPSLSNGNRKAGELADLELCEKDSHLGGIMHIPRACGGSQGFGLIV